MNARTDILRGVVHGMPAEEYHRIQAMSAGGLKRMRQSPAHFFGMQLNADRPMTEPTPAMKNGTMAHCAMFERDEFAKRYVSKPAGTDFRTKEGKAWRDSQTAEIVEPEEIVAAFAQADAVHALPDVAALLAEGHAEVSAFWHDDATGVLCKCRPDWVSPAGDGVILVDGKTCRDASLEGFSKTIWNYCYHLQAAWYSDGYEKATGLKVYGFVFAAVESTYPHVAAAYMLDDDVLDRARAEIRRLVSLYASCQATGEWPGYAQGIQSITLPKWATKEIA